MISAKDVTVNYKPLRHVEHNKMFVFEFRQQNHFLLIYYPIWDTSYFQDSLERF